MNDTLSTTEVSWVVGRSAGTIRDLIREGEIEGVRLPGGFRVPKAEVLRLARERIEEEAGRKVSERELEQLIDELIATNSAAT